MINDDLYAFEEWRDIPDVKFHYQASNMGRICRVCPSGKRVYLTDYKHGNNRIVEMFKADGRRVKQPRITIIGDVWLGRKEGYVYATKNGVQTDVRVDNIMYAKRSDIAKRCNRAKQMAVLKINRKGEVVEIYSSLTECAKHTGMCKSAIAKRCRGMYESILAQDGYAYCYEDNEKYLRQLGKIFGWKKRA